MVYLRSAKKYPANDGGEILSTAAVTKTDSITKVVSTSGMNRVIFVSLLLDLLAFTLILPLFPAILDYYRHNDSSHGLFQWLENHIKSFQSFVGAPDRFYTVLFGGFLGSLFSFLQFVASPIFGGLADVYGRRPLMLLSAAGIVVSNGFWVVASNFTLFVLARIIGGLSKANISLATAVITDKTTFQTRGRGMAYIGLAFSIGFLIGPIIGASFSHWAKGNFVAPAILALTLSLLDLVFLFFFFEETLPEDRRQTSLTFALSQAVTYINPYSLFRFESISNISVSHHHSLRVTGCAYFIYLFFYSGLEFTLTFLTHIRFNFTSMQQGKMFLFIGFLMAIIQGGYSRRIPAQDQKLTAQRGLLLIVPSFALIGFSTNIWMLYTGLSLFAISTSVVVPCMTAMVSNYGQSHQKGIVMGVHRSLGALGRAFGPATASILYWTLGPEICYCIGGLGLLFPYFMLRNLKKIE